MWGIAWLYIGTCPRVFASIREFSILTLRAIITYLEQLTVLLPRFIS